MKEKIEEYIKIRQRFRISHNKLLKEKFAKDPYCYYCKNEMKVYEEIRSGYIKVRNFPKDMATRGPDLIQRISQC